MDNELKKGIDTAVAASLLASAVTGGCVPVRSGSVDSVGESGTPVVQQTYAGSLPTIPSEMPTIEYSPNIESTETQSQTKMSTSVEEHEFDDSVLDFTEWENYNLVEVEDKDKGYTVTVSNETSLFQIPLKKDNFVDFSKEDSEVKEIEMPQGLTFEVAQVRTLRGPNGEQVKVANIANTFGEHAVSAMVLSARDKYGNEQNFVNESQDTESSVSYIVSEKYVYPNKIINTLEALKNISRYQEEHGPMVAGEEQSYLNLIGLTDPSKLSEFSVGLTSTKEEFTGAGVCAMATALSMLAHLSGPEQAIILQQWGHPIRYAQGPYSPSEFVVDATVGLRPLYDFIFSLNHSKYLKVTLSLSPLDIDYEDTAPDGVGGISDAFLVVTLSFSNELPEDQSEYIQKKLDDYKNYRQTKHESPLDQNSKVSRYPIRGHKHAVDMLYNPEEIRSFADEIEQNKDIQNIYELQNAVNNYPNGSEMRFDEYIRTTDWYRNFVNSENKSNVDRILSLASITQIKNQPLQCVGFVMLASWLYPDLHIPYVGGIDSNSARGLIPPEIRNYTYKDIISIPSGIPNVVATAGRIPLDYYKEGDLFVRTDGSKMADGEPAGHIGVVLGRKLNKNGEVVLLVADSNRHGDGRIRIFEVTESNRDEILGYPVEYLLSIK